MPEVPAGPYSHSAQGKAEEYAYQPSNLLANAAADNMGNRGSLGAQNWALLSLANILSAIRAVVVNCLVLLAAIAACPRVETVHFIAEFLMFDTPVLSLQLLKLATAPERDGSILRQSVHLL